MTSPRFSGRDVNAAQKTISGLLKLLYPNAATPELQREDSIGADWAVRWILSAAFTGFSPAHEQAQHV